ncbi:unnamed protein product, partial [Ixodes pacificus]
MKPKKTLEEIQDIFYPRLIRKKTPVRKKIAPVCVDCCNTKTYDDCIDDKEMVDRMNKLTNAACAISAEKEGQTTPCDGVFLQSEIKLRHPTSDIRKIGVSIETKSMHRSERSFSNI